MDVATGPREQAASSASSDPQHPAIPKQASVKAPLSGSGKVPGPDSSRPGPRPPASGRKRSVFPTNIKSLQSQVDDAAQTLKQLTLENFRVRERERMGELVLAVQTRLGDSCAEVRAGLPNNPFAALVCATVDDVRKASPAWLEERLGRVIRDIVKLQASGATLLRAHPELLGPPAPLPPRPVHEGARDPLLLPPSDPLLAFKPANEEESAQRQDLVRAAEIAQQLSVTMRYLFLVCPEALVAMSGHHKHVRTMASWGDVQSTLAKVADSAANEPALLGPIVAPEEHWQRVVVGLHLSSTQLMQASVLRDILVAARQAIQQRRLALTQELGSQRPGGGLEPHQPGSQHTDLRLDQLSRAEVCIARLSATVDQERHNLLVLNEVMLMHILTPLQAALAFAYSDPYMFDGWAILHAAAEEFTESTISELASATG